MNLPFAHLAHTGLHCQGCGMLDPCGVHYDDCTLLDGSEEFISRPLKWWEDNEIFEYEAIPRT